MRLKAPPIGWRRPHAPHSDPDSWSSSRVPLQLAHLPKGRSGRCCTYTTISQLTFSVFRTQAGRQAGLTCPQGASQQAGQEWQRTGQNGEALGDSTDKEIRSCPSLVVDSQQKPVFSPVTKVVGVGIGHQLD